MKTVDLRSDTVTTPTPAMREAMANAEVGDDVYGEDPTINRLEALAAARVGKEAGLFVPSGTMGNLAAVLVHCGRGDEVIFGDEAHGFLSEAGGAAALGGVHPRTVTTSADGTLSMEGLSAALRADDPHYPTSRLVCLENTHNVRGGVPLTEPYTAQVGRWAHDHGLRLHLDGARIFNAAVALRVPAEQLAAPADSVTFCLSKGLSAPVGSVLCGSKDFIHRARRVRKQLGGGMRQAGVLAAAGIVALDTMVDRLADDHRRAAELAHAVADLPKVRLDWDPPPTNMVYFHIDPEASVDSEELTRRMGRRGILIDPAEPLRIRMVTHIGIEDEDLGRTAEALASCLAGSE